MPIDPNDLTASLRRLQRSGDDPSVLDALNDTVRACVDVFGVTGSGLLVADDEQILRVVVSTDGPGHVLESVEADHGEGPCTDAFVNDELTATHDLLADSRWPRVTDAVAPLRVRAVLGVPIRLGGVPLGTLDVYRDHPHSWDDTEQRALIRYSEVIGLTLSAALAAERAGELSEQLQYALDHRIIIERAIGFVMARHDVDAVAAFNELRRSARASRRKVGDIARTVLDTTRLPDEPTR